MPDKKNPEPVPEKTGAGDSVPEADQVESEPEAPNRRPPEMDDSAPVEPIRDR